MRPTFERYVVGQNDPGYMPESTPLGPYTTWHEAATAVKEEIDDHIDSMLETADPDPAYEAELEARRDTVLFDAGLDLDERDIKPTESGMIDVVFEGRAFFIRPHVELYQVGWREGAGPDDGPKPRGPCEWPEAVERLADMIRDDYDSVAETQDQEYGSHADADEKLAEARADLKALVETGKAQTVAFMSRTFYIEPVEDDS